MHVLDLFGFFVLQEENDEAAGGGDAGENEDDESDGDEQGEYDEEQEAESDEEEEVSFCISKSDHNGTPIISSRSLQRKKNQRCLSKRE